MYQPYPGGAQLPETQRPPAPASVRSAVKVMYAGAVASLIGIVVDRTTLSATKRAIAQHFPKLTTSQVNGQGRVLMAGWIVGGLIAAGLWIFIAKRASAAGAGQGPPERCCSASPPCRVVRASSSSLRPPW